MLMFGRRIACALVAASAVAVASPAFAQSTLKASLHSDLKILDPIWTTALITTHHGHMIYDTLFAMDEKLQIQPQMVDKWEVSPDKLTYTFTLRDGMEWHDGKPVTAEDCVASIRRWGARDGMGQKLMSLTADLSAPDAKTIKLVLKQPYGLVIASLGKSSSNVPFMMPKSVASGDPNTQITETIGSGPFMFKKDEWKPGEKVVYLRNPKYKARSEPPSGMAGGKVAKVDRVEWIWIPDSQTQINALLNGEIDMVENVPPDLLPLIAKDKNVRIQVISKAGRQYAMRFNTQTKPFDNPKVREAVLYALDQNEILAANVGNPDYFRACKSVFPCGSPLESTKGWDDKVSGNVAKGKELLAASGYDGTPAVFLHQTDVVGHSNLANVAKAQLEKIGLKIDLQPMDWQTLVARRAKKDPLDKGGWSAFFTSWGATDVLNPASTAFLNASCDKATFGWPCDATLEKLRDAYAAESDPARQKAIAEEVQLRVDKDYPPHAPIGQFTVPTAVRSNVNGLLPATGLTMWNIEKK